MAAAGRRADPSLEQSLFAEGHRFDFFQAVRVLERLYPGRAPVGGGGPARAEVVRFQAALSLAFPPSAVQRLVPPDDGGPAAMDVAFMGLTGPLGVLPPHYTELLLTRGRAKDDTLRSFLDLLNHRLVSLFYRAWEKYHFPVAYERAQREEAGDDPFSLALFALMGLGTGGLRGRLAVRDAALVFYVGLLAQQPRSASAVEGVLRDYFDVPVRVVPLVGDWLPIPEESRTRLGAAGANNALGVDAVAGSRAWDPQARFRLRLGPLGLARFREFLPSGGAHRPLLGLTRFMVGEQPSFDAQLVLAAAEVPGCRTTAREGEGGRLGWTSWLKTRDFVYDAEDLVLGEGGIGS